MSDFLILNALCIDGSGREPFTANVAIEGEYIESIGKGTTDAKRVIDAQGLVISPGFIDTHSHSEFTLSADGRAQGKIVQGVTTEINGNCGISAAPIQGDALAQREADFLEYHINQRWQHFEEYYRIIRSQGIALNFATLCGQGNLRASAIGYRKGRASSAEMVRMCSLLRDAATSGARGISTGLIYPPGVFTDTDELIELCRFFSGIKPEGIYASHMRSETDYLIEAVEETLRIGWGASLNVHISHLKTGGKGNWHKIDRVIELINEAQERGLRVTCDRYPYIASSTDLDTILPKWVYEGGLQEELKRLNDPETLRRIRQELSMEDKDIWKEIYVSSTYRHENLWMEGLSITEIAARCNSDPIDTALNIIISDNARTGGIFFSMYEDNLRRFLKLPYMMIGSDSAVRSFDGITNKGKPHPRGFGTFPRFIGRYVRDEGLMSIEEGIRRITSLPAETFGLQKRGMIREGYYADITVFDYKKIIDNADFKEPFQPPSGIEMVFVNGIPVYEGGIFTGALPGKVLL